MTNMECQSYAIYFSFYDPEFVPYDAADQRLATGE